MSVWLQKKYCILCDASTVTPKPYSYSRLQLMWWTVIILTSFVSIFFVTGRIPAFDFSTIALLGIGAATTTAARIVDVADENKEKVEVAEGDAPAAVVLSRDLKSEGFWLDILSDKTGVSIHRFQAVVFNLFFGLWFIYQTIINLKALGASYSDATINSIMPIIPNNNLILLGISAGTYIALKSSENK